MTRFDPREHSLGCAYHVDQYPWECTCGFIAQGMSTGTAKTPKAVEGRSPASPVGTADAPPDPSTPTLTMGESE